MDLFDQLFWIKHSMKWCGFLNIDWESIFRAKNKLFSPNMTLWRNVFGSAGCISWIRQNIEICSFDTMLSTNHQSIAICIKLNSIHLLRAVVMKIVSAFIQSTSSWIFCQVTFQSYQFPNQAASIDLSLTSVKVEEHIWMSVTLMSDTQRKLMVPKPIFVYGVRSFSLFIFAFNFASIVRYSTRLSNFIIWASIWTVSTSAHDT